MSRILRHYLNQVAKAFGRPFGRAIPVEQNSNTPFPENALVVVGDIHGRADLLGSMLQKISAVCPTATLVFVGDYVDRGPESRAVIEILQGLNNAICLRGNHETMMLEFLDDPIERGGRWLRNGGIQTLQSYGINIDEESSATEVLAASKELQATLAKGAENWLRSLPVFHKSGSVVVAHAGPDPARPIDGHPEKDFLWGHRRFLRDKRTDGVLVIHGHWAKKRPTYADGRINVDTGAWNSGRLTAVTLGVDGAVKFIDVR